ncbi:MAG: branched-chain amino acid ABC transporter ATP-binding protein [Spirochaetes bacterium]|nr:ABC transporter ATP-binding protein [Deltaproteobacteria bacterium]RKY03925.1 MAG: branched-chain amino acid ABC transporter ATP-binding protein [Spirochaetota bacterium]
MLEVRRINVGYKDVQVLWDISLEVKEGEIVTVIGPNGAGKSTLLKGIVGLLPLMNRDKESGIFFKGKDISDFSPERLIRIGITIVPEGSRVFPEMTVLDNLRMGAYIHKSKEEKKRKLEEILELFPKLAERRNQKARTMSGGERQMLAIGRALMSNPEFLLMDEPSLGLHPIMVSHIFKTIEAISKRGVTVLLVEQNVHFSLEISNRGYVLENGHIVMEGEGKKLLESEHVKKAYLAL